MRKILEYLFLKEVIQEISEISCRKNDPWTLSLMIRIGESCLFSMTGRCYNHRSPHYERHCPFISKQFGCDWYNGNLPGKKEYKIARE